MQTTEETRQVDYKALWEEQFEAREKGLPFIQEDPTDITPMVEERYQHLNPMMPISYYPHALHIKEARGIYMIEKNGQVNLDCVNNVSHIGHCHPEYVARIQKQVATLCTNSRYLYDNLNNVTKKLLARLPKDLSVITFCNSGTEANDLALQMAEIYTRKKGVICLDGAYHGISKATMDISPYKWGENYPVSSHVIVSKSPCTYRGHGKDDPISIKEYGDYLLSIIKEDTGAFISELMQSCAGQVIPPKDFYKEIYRVLKERRIVSIADEVQTGFGRLGSHFWCFEYYDVIPDIVVCGKAMGNGMPVAAVVCKKEIAWAFNKRGIEYFSTFGGNPLACTAAEAVLDIITSDKLQENALRTGKYLSLKLRALLDYPFVGDIRGVGLFQGFQIVKDKTTKDQDGEMAKEIIMRARDRGVLLSRDGVYHNIIKIKPPIIFNQENVDQLMKVLNLVLKELTK